MRGQLLCSLKIMRRSVEGISVRSEGSLLAAHRLAGQREAVLIQSETDSVFVLTVPCEVFLPSRHIGLTDKIEVLDLDPFRHALIDEDPVTLGAFLQIKLSIPVDILPDMRQLMSEGGDQRNAGSAILEYDTVLLLIIDGRTKDQQTLRVLRTKGDTDFLLELTLLHHLDRDRYANVGTKESGHIADDSLAQFFHFSLSLHQSIAACGATSATVRQTEEFHTGDLRTAIGAARLTVSVRIAVGLGTVLTFTSLTKFASVKSELL